jgi:hypothetical protein
MGELRKLVSSLTEGATPGPWHAVTQYDPPNDPRWWLDNEAGDSSFVTADHVATMLNAILTLFAALDAAPPAVDVERLARAIHEASGTHSKTPTRMICDNPQWGRAPGVRGGHPRPPRHPMTDLDAIRERARLMGFNGASIVMAQEDRRALLAYIDGLAEAVGKADGRYEGDTLYVSRAAVLAILRGE